MDALRTISNGIKAMIITSVLWLAEILPAFHDEVQSLLLEAGEAQLAEQLFAKDLT